MSDIDTGELRELLAAATPGLWRFTDSETVDDVWDAGMTVVSNEGDPIANVLDEWYENDPGEPAPLNDAALIAAAVNALPALLDAADERDAAIRQARADALREAADAWQWGEWTAITEPIKAREQPQRIIGAAQAVTDWLRARVERESAP